MMPEARSHALRISYNDLGSGEPALLLMPGWCVGRQVFNRLPALCAETHRVLSLDWRGHGESGSAPADFGLLDLVEDALAVIESSGASQVVPVALAHSGWIALSLRRKLRERIPRIVLLDWILTQAPRQFLSALSGLQDPHQWEATRDQLFALWLHGVEVPGLKDFICRDMGSYGFDMWARAGREITAAYAEQGSALDALSRLKPVVETLHLYAQPADDAYLAAQQEFAVRHPWFRVHRLNAQSHFPMFEVPEEMACAIDSFVSGG
jgi:pimeloyl-ACP methyl ester carboxylesterase